MNSENERKHQLIAKAIKNKGKGVSATPDPITAERHREFLKTKKGTHGDYNFSPGDEEERVRGNNELEKLELTRKANQSDNLSKTDKFISLEACRKSISRVSDHIRQLNEDLSDSPFRKHLESLGLKPRKK